MALINRCGGDPVVLFSAAEARAELQRWLVPVPDRKLEEAEPLYTQRLRQVRSEPPSERKSFSN